MIKPDGGPEVVTNTRSHIISFPVLERGQKPLRIDTGGWGVNCSTLGFRGLCNYPHQLKFNFLLILYVY